MLFKTLQQALRETNICRNKWKEIKCISTVIHICSERRAVKTIFSDLIHSSRSPWSISNIQRVKGAGKERRRINIFLGMYPLSSLNGDCYLKSRMIIFIFKFNPIHTLWTYKFILVFKSVKKILMRPNNPQKSKSGILGPNCF